MSICPTCGIYVSASNPNACGADKCDAYKCFDPNEVTTASSVPPKSQPLPCPRKVSIAGVDDRVNIESIKTLVSQYPQTEIGVLYFPEKEGLARNPSAGYRKKLLENIPSANLAAHLCGQFIFEQILSDEFETSCFNAELSKYSRLQLNINARQEFFSRTQVLAIYRKLLRLGNTLILQYHETSASVIEEFLVSVGPLDTPKINVLFDSSKGRGQAPAKWAPPVEFENKFSVFTAFAGGITPENVTRIRAQLSSSCTRDYGLDLESGVRTNNEFDLLKATQLLRRLFG